MSNDYMAEIEREISAFLLGAERSQARRVLPEVGRLERTAFHLLGQLVREGPLRPSAVAHLIRLDLSTVSRHVTALEGAGLVAREPDPADRRACLLRATERGEEILDRLRAARRERMRAALGDWPMADRRQLVRMLGRLNAALFGTEDATAPSDPATNRPATNRPTANQPATNRSAADRPPTNQPATHRPAANQPDISSVGGNRSSV
jgi:DNA-binding MarR family transcriptional regulator